MFFYLLLLFTGVPLIELAILIKIGQRIGVMSTILIVVITGVLGATLAKLQGLQALRRLREELSYGIMPASTIFDGFLIFVAGCFLITPGLMTDLTGFLLLIPFTRNKLKIWLIHKIQKMIDKGNVEIFYRK